jgi:hypothetical protein
VLRPLLAIDPKVEHEAVDHRVNFEMDRQAKEEATRHVFLVDEVIEGKKYQVNNLLII